MDDSCLRNRLAFAPSHIRAIELQIELCGVLYTICGERLLIVPRTRCSIRLNVSIGCERGIESVVSRQRNVRMSANNFFILYASSETE